MTSNPRLARIVELADKGPSRRAALAEEAAALLMDWPCACPLEMRPVFENLLAKAAREVDAPTRARLRLRLDADPELCARLLPREDPLAPLIDAARQGAALLPRLAETLALDDGRAAEILNEETGEALAIACKGAGIARAAYSTLALLAFPRARMNERLAVYDRVALPDAARTLQGWRSAPPLHTAAAAE